MSTIFIIACVLILPPTAPGAPDRRVEREVTHLFARSVEQCQADYAPVVYRDKCAKYASEAADVKGRVVAECKAAPT